MLRHANVTPLHGSKHGTHPPPAGSRCWFCCPFVRIRCHPTFAGDVTVLRVICQTSRQVIPFTSVKRVTTHLLAHSKKKKRKRKSSAAEHSTGTVAASQPRVRYLFLRPPGGICGKTGVTPRLCTTPGLRSNPVWEIPRFFLLATSVCFFSLSLHSSLRD